MALDALLRSHNLTHRDGVSPVVLLAITVLLAVLPATSTAAGTTPTTFGPAVAHPFRSLHIGTWGLYVSTLNPLSITTSDDFVVTYSVYSTLTKYDKAYRVVPDLSYNWTVASDQKTWTFRIVPGATFANPSNPSDSSHAVTADDVVFSYNLQIAQTGSVEHAYVQGVASVAKLDDYTVQIVTIQPYAPMLTMTSTVPILPSYIWGTIPNPIAYPNSAPVGSGPIYYDGVNTTANLLTLRRNPHFYGDPFYCSSPRPDEIRFINYATSTGLVSDFLAGTSGLDAIQRVAPQDYKSGLARWPTKWAVANGDIAELSVNVMTPEIRAMYPQFQTGGAYNNQLLLNHTVRDAIAMSVNKTTVVEYALLGLGEEADTLVPPANPWHYPIPESERVKFDPAAARAALNAAGWRYDSTGALNPSATPLYKANSADPLRFRFFVPDSDPAFAAAAVNISAWLAETGIRTTDALGNPGYQVFAYNQMVGIWFAGNYDLWIWDWIFSPGSDISLDILFIETTMAIGALSDNFYSNATYDSLYNQSLVAVDPISRRAITDEMQRMIYRYASYIMPYERETLYAARAGRSGHPTEGWGGWGDWSNEVGLTPDSGLTDLWAQVFPRDNPPPWIWNVSSSAGFTGSATMLSAGASDPDGARVTYTWTFGDGTTDVTTTTPWVFHTYGSPGVYAFRVRVSDGEWSVCAASHATISQSTAGNLPPYLSAIQFQLSRLNGTSGMPFEDVANPIPFNVTVADPEGDPITVTWAFGDGTTETDVVMGTSAAQIVSRTHAFNNGGTYQVVVSATDGKTGSGNHEVSVGSGPIQVSVANEPVTVIIVSGLVGIGGWFRSNVSVSLQAWDNTSGLDGTAYRLDGGTWHDYAAPFIVTGDGNHVVEYFSTNKNGVSGAFKTSSIRIDSTRPDVTYALSGTSSADGWYASPVSLTLVGADATSGVAAIVYVVDNGTPQVYLGPVALTDGTHSVRFLAVDFAGNPGTVGIVSVRVDTEAPSLALAVPSGIVTTSRVFVSWTGTDNGSGIVRYELSVDGGPFQSLGTNSTAALVLSDGAHLVAVKAIDAVGHSATKTASIQVDTNPFSITGPYSGAPSIGVLAILSAIVLTLLWRRRSRRASPRGDVPPKPPAKQ
ncbi:MAG TPA: ABC transporter substrate-binding protein [Thermoplasmata archaeon]|nr:ABC transporter substrate-binding protein [Thermoplasmata archaeon]